VTHSYWLNQFSMQGMPVALEYKLSESGNASDAALQLSYVTSRRTCMAQAALSLEHSAVLAAHRNKMLPV
jgi:hypothetical protein